ncbi:hypothetical protein [Tunturiibacter gelidiferens]|uniref:hypothetical protein n=1 Tax=Tunturiibacter gelidiferens TaxID=3069689 RepID=UPI003D9AF8B2
MPLRSSLRLAAVLFVLLAPLTLPAQNPDRLHTASRQELDVIKVLLAQEAAWNRGDLPAFASGYKDSPDTLFITHQISRGYAGLLDQYKRDYPTRAAMGTLSFSELEVHPSTKTTPSASASTTSSEAKKMAATQEESSPSSSKKPPTAGRSSSTTPRSAIFDLIALF